MTGVLINLPYSKPIIIMDFKIYNPSKSNRISSHLMKSNIAELFITHQVDRKKSLNKC